MKYKKPSRYFKQFIFLLFFSLFFIKTCLLGQTKDTIRVLFVGNSYTYFWNMPQLLSAMAATQHKVIITRKSTAGGAYLKEHWEGKKGLKTRSMIETGNWDIVVIQNNSRSGIDNPADFMEYGKKFIQLVKQKGAQPLLYMTWAREYNPLMQDSIAHSYQRLAGETDTKVVPVGLIWDKARKSRPDLQLFDPDGSHPSPIGVYLIASAFYRVITGQATKTIPERIATVDRDGEELYLSIMSKPNVEFIHDLVDSYLRRNPEITR